MRIIRFFDCHRKWNNVRNEWLDRMRLYGFFNLIWDVIANIFLYIYFKLSLNKYTIEKGRDKVKKGLIVSLTSFPKRIGYVWMTIETILRQEYLPEKIILYLSKEQFPQEYNDLPDNLLKLRKRGLDIVFKNDDLKSHKKYFYAFIEYPNNVIVTIDDDVFYPEDMLKTLWDTHVLYPDAVVGNRAKKIYNMIPRYEHWPKIDKFFVSFDLLFVGCAGILYPPLCMGDDVCNTELIKSLAFSADDIWLSCMARLKGTIMVATGYDYHHLRILIPGNSSLFDINSYTGNQESVEKLNHYYFKKIGKRPFVDMVGIK